MEKVHVDVKDVNGSKKELLESEDSEKLDDQTDGEEYSESNSLLPPRKGGMSRKSDKDRRKVQWNDRNGNKLVEVLEFEPSLELTVTSALGCVVKSEVIKLEWHSRKLLKRTLKRLGYCSCMSNFAASSEGRFIHVAISEL
ncbi:hypothetical protein JRO89_XS03G0084400 [Xanthoceras sorbifolium]|uniref:Uncharacterized protein n=1 Tax=Xanthoceras sorbifolium TaxID=99658 RepID=A0ABQ8I9S6_9ROSI|nr:hypothetical protein JRO89_XS03G0084400 [Xanthoceras sorbifolium]